MFLFREPFRIINSFKIDLSELSYIGENYNISTLNKSLKTCLLHNKVCTFTHKSAKNFLINYFKGYLRDSFSLFSSNCQKFSSLSIKTWTSVDNVFTGKVLFILFGCTNKSLIIKWQNVINSFGNVYQADSFRDLQSFLLSSSLQSKCTFKLIPSMEKKISI